MLVRRCTGTSAKSGSATYSARSRNARRIASATWWMYSGLLWPIAARSYSSRMFSIVTMAIPPELGGGMEMTSYPRYVPVTGERSRAS